MFYSKGNATGDFRVRDPVLESFSGEFSTPVGFGRFLGEVPGPRRPRDWEVRLGCSAELGSCPRAFLGPSRLLLAGPARGVLGNSCCFLSPWMMDESSASKHAVVVRLPSWRNGPCSRAAAYAAAAQPAALRLFWKGCSWRCEEVTLTPPQLLPYPSKNASVSFI